MKLRVLAYIVRANNGGLELLVCRHRDVPEAGVQVIAGTVEPGEAVEAALFREIEEESGFGRDKLRLLRKLGKDHNPGSDEEWHGFELTPLVRLPDRWSHSVAGEGEDKGLFFNYYWVPLSAELELAGKHGRFLMWLNRPG